MKVKSLLYIDHQKRRLMEFTKGSEPLNLPDTVRYFATYMHAVQVIENRVMILTGGEWIETTDTELIFSIINYLADIEEKRKASASGELNFKKAV